MQSSSAESGAVCSTAMDMVLIMQLLLPATTTSFPVISK